MNEFKSCKKINNYHEATAWMDQHGNLLDRAIIGKETFHLPINISIPFNDEHVTTRIPVEITIIVRKPAV